MSRYRTGLGWIGRYRISNRLHKGPRERLARASTRVRVRAALLSALTLVPLSLAVPASAAPADRTSVLVEFEAPPALAAPGGPADPSAGGRERALRQAGQRAAVLAEDHRRFLGQARGNGIDTDVIHELTAAYNGLVVDVPATKVAALAAMPGVRAVHANASYAHALTDSVPLVGAPEVWQRTDPAGQQVTGAGTVVAVLDTGIDYRHPDLGGGFGPDYKVVAGYDLVNDDADPMDDNGHGTHVAGIVAADGAVRGVAPGARLTAYKVLNRSGSGDLFDIIAGLDAAVAPDNPHRADVVNLSLSGPGDGTDPLSVAAGHAVGAGAVVVGAAGNAGPGNQTIGSPAAAPGVLAVGASVSGVRVPRARMVEPVERDLRAARFDFSAAPPADPLRLAVVDVGQGVPGSYDDVDVTGKAVLVDQTRPAFELAAYAEERGAAAVFFYFPDFWGFLPQGLPMAGQPGPAQAGATVGVDAFGTGFDDGRLDKILVMQIPGASAAALQDHLGDGPTTVEITAVDATDQLADFSSRGPSGAFGQKPNLVAPGVEVLSTLPDNGYGRGSGTSMAAPHVAGAAALMIQLHRDWTGGDVSAALATSARRLDGLAPQDQGAGRLDLPAAATTTVVATPAAISFGLAGTGGQIDRTATLTLRNLGTAVADVSVGTTPYRAAGASITVSPPTARLAPGAATELHVRVRLPAPDADGDIGGWVDVDVAGTKTSVPFLLAARRLGVHVTPDPAPAGTEVSVFVRSPAELPVAPAIEVTCPGIDPQRPSVEPAGTRIWRARVAVGDAGRCDVRTGGTADQRYGAPVLTGTGAFEAVAPPGPGRGTAFWQPIGPNAEAGWLAFGEERNQMAVVPLGSPSIFRSDDRLGSWRELRTMPMAGGAPVDVAVHPRDDDTIFVAVNGGGGVDPSYQGRVVRTEDGGVSWRILPGPDARVGQIALHDSGQVLAVADDAGVRITRDLGNTWTEVPRTWTGLRDLHWIGSDLYLATNSGLLVVRAAAGPDPADPTVVLRPGVLGWAGRVAGDTRGIFVSAYPSPWLYASHDGGATFERVLQTTGISIQALKLVGDDVYALQANRLWVGSDRGRQWTSWGDPVPNAISFDVGLWPGAPGSVYVADFGAGLYAADQPGQYQRVGVAGARVYALAAAAGDGGPTLVAGTARDTFHTTLPDRSAIRPDDLEWRSSGGEGISGAAALFLATSPADPAVVYKVRTDAFLTFGIHRSDDGGATWRRLASPSEAPFALLVHPADPNRVYVSYGSVTGSGLVASADGGQTWRKNDQGRIFRALAGDPTDADRIWAGDHTGLYLSEDAGVTFRQLADTPVTAIAVDPADPRHLIVGGRGLYTSRDGGATLRPADHVDLDMWVSDVEFAPGASTSVFAATTGFFDEIGVLHNGRGVLSSADGGASWQPFDRGLANQDATSLAFSGDARHLFVGTIGGSVHRIELQED